MRCKNILKEIIKYVIATISVLAISLNTSRTNNLFGFGNGNSFLWIIVLIFAYQMLNKAIEIKDKRLKLIALFVGILLSTLEVVGDSINKYMNLSGIFLSPTHFVTSVIKWAGYISLITTALIIIYDKVNKTIEKYKNIEYSENNKTIISKWFTNNKRSYYVCIGIIFLMWVPYLLKYYPGVLTPDSMDQVKQALGINTINAHHPLFHTLIIKVCIEIGCAIGNQNTGVLIYSIMQMIVMSAIFSFVLYYMAKRKIPILVRIITLFFFAIYPVNAIYSITMWKNILSAGTILLFVICMIEIATNQLEFFSHKKNLIAIIVVSLLLIYTLNNGIYIILLSIPAIYLIAKKYWKKISIIIIIIFSIYFIVNTVLFSVLDIQKGSIKEALSIPLQQFARVVKFEENKLSDAEKQSIYNLLPNGDLGKLYNPTLSDPIKALFNDEYFGNNKMEFVTTWVKLFFKFPKEYIESFLCNSYGYWYPEATNWVAAKYIQQDDEINIYQSPKIDCKIIDNIVSLTNKREIPVISMAFSLGLVFWLIIIVMTYCIYIKKHNLAAIYTPILILWLTVLASPVFCEFRYLYGMIVCLPILLSVPLLNIEELD